MLLTSSNTLKLVILCESIQVCPSLREQLDLPSYLSSSPRPSASPPSVVPKHHYYHFPEGKDDFNKPHHSYRVWTSVFIAMAAFFFLLILYVIVRKVVKKFSVVPGQGVAGLELGHLSSQEERQDPSPSSPSSPQ
ncbi:transmembrane protein, putative [Medicago truncatula]|uniref:Transmembrane protein, putative n=1 Tax=Medicago truncatula TaxID=3880 RepID=A0A072UQ47_MEDTR|nr:transmembrane protein, putative [Medicago truncatula]